MAQGLYYLGGMGKPDLQSPGLLVSPVADRGHPREVEDHDGAGLVGGFLSRCTGVALEGPDGDMLVGQPAPQTAQPLSIPELPAKDIVQARNATHFPLVHWCAMCKASRGRGPPRRRCQAGDIQTSVVSVDDAYCRVEGMQVEHHGGIYSTSKSAAAKTSDIRRLNRDVCVCVCAPRDACS